MRTYYSTYVLFLILGIDNLIFLFIVHKIHVCAKNVFSMTTKTKKSSMVKDKF